ncbi:MAG: acyl-CoA thioesterase [Thermodesulfobacteriota bacterium]
MSKLVRSRCRVIYGDTDAMGVAYYSNYLRWFEMGRNEWLRSVGVTYSEIERAGTYAPVSEVYCHYFYPVRYDDWILIDTDVEYLRRASIKFAYRILREESGEEAARGYTIHAFVDGNGRIVRAPQILLDALRPVGQDDPSGNRSKGRG